MEKILRAVPFLAASIAVLFLSMPLLVGQTPTGSISGLVKDESGAVVPNANVVVTNTGTGVRRTVPSDAGGRYHVPGLDAGMYQVEAQAPGFQTSVRTGIQLTVGRDLEIEMLLRLGQVEQITEVTAEAPLVETVANTLAGLVDEQTIQELPLNGRSFSQLVALQPGVHSFRSKDDFASAGDVFSIGGSRQTTNLYLLDGIEMLGGDFQDARPGGVLSKLMGVDAIQEFNVLTANYSAAYGKRSGGMMNVMTKPGTNQFHGTASYFHRNDNLDARNFFDPEEAGEFRRNQFAGSLGGPIKRDRTFFFGNYEGLREALGESNIALVPNNLTRSGCLPADENRQDAGCPRGFENVGVSPQVRPFMDAFFPEANGEVFSRDGTAEYFAAPSAISRQDFWLLRMDHHFSERDSIFGRYNFSDAKNGDPQPDTVFQENTSTRDQTATLEYKRSYVTTLNIARFGFTRSRTFSAVEPIDPEPFASLRFIEGAEGIGNIAFTEGGGSSSANVLTSVGSDRPLRRYVLNQFELSDQVFHYRGGHSLQFGGKVQWIHNNDNIRGGTDFGAYEFPDLRSFLQADPSLFTGLIPGGSAYKSYRRNYFAVFVHDDFKFRPNLTLNFGLRYEFMTVPTEKYNRISNFRTHIENGFIVPDTEPTVGQPFWENDHNTFAPRVGFAWDPRANGRTVLRGGFGVFYDHPITEFRFFTRGNPPFYNTVSVDNPPFPFGLAGGSGEAAQSLPEGVAFEQDTPTKLQWNFSIQRQLTDRAVFQVAYLGSHAYHLTYMGDNNSAIPTSISADGTKFFARGLPRRNPELGRGRDLRFGASAFYHSFQFDYSQRVTQGLRAKTTYTYSSNIDDSEGGVTAGHHAGAPPNSQDPDNIRADRGLASVHARHIFSTNFTYALPGASLGGVAGRVLGGWELSSIIGANTGEPLTAQIGFNNSRNRIGRNADRPDLAPGASNNPTSGVTAGCGSIPAGQKLGTPDRFYDPCAFVLPTPGTYGNVGRNTIIGPGFFNLDMSLVKNTQVNERVGVEFRAEFFNILNRANFGTPSVGVLNNDANNRWRESSGVVTYTINTSRQIQFGTKITF